MTHPVQSLMNLSPHECRTLVAEASIARIAFVSGGLPVVVPVTCAVLDDAAVFCTAPDTRLAAAAARGVLAFEVDEIDLRARTGWSVVVTGVAERVNDPLQEARVRSVLEPWAPGAHEVFLRLPLTRMTGRRIATR
jgi:nitroimidazol reductase NimA-like FMN-containing flavoprotein (pyridoxamine 5'-phosphate oxidase superfamily)